MTAELTSEEVVTKLLVSNSFIKPAKNSSGSFPNSDNLKKFIENNNSKNVNTKLSKYTFINENINWGF